MDEDRKEKLRALARQKVKSLMEGPKLTALSPGDEKTWFNQPAGDERPQAVRPPIDGRPDLSRIRSIVEEVLDGGDVYITTHESISALVVAAREMGEDVLGNILARLPEKRCSSLLSYSAYLSDGSRSPEPWDWQFLVGRVQIQKLGAGLRGCLGTPSR